MINQSGEKWGKMYYFISLLLGGKIYYSHPILIMHFLGNIEAKIDTKGRVFVPAAFRKILVASSQSALILRKDIFQNCLVLYPQSVWDAEVEQLRSRLGRWNKTQQQLLRQFVIDADRLEIDSNGRVLIPKRYLDMVNIASDLRFVGVDNTIEIWTNETLHEVMLPADDFGAMLEQMMSGNNELDNSQENGK